MDADSTKRRFQRSQFAVVLVLAPLNGTFVKKCLVVPFAPDMLKLGRQTTARTQAAPDNGYFDSRVLSRQHAEIWADYDTGKVWLHDAKSSNGTYINSKRLSSENTESEPYELKNGDLLDLGIDIMCNDETKQMYKKISAKVEKISMLPLHVGLQQRQLSAESNPNGNANGNLNGFANDGTSEGTNGGSSLQKRSHNAPRSLSSKFPSHPTLPSLSRSPSLETLKGAGIHKSSLSGGEAIFGSMNQAETMALNHAHTTAGGQLVRDTIKQNVNFEIAAKRLVVQIRAVKADTAKIQSVASMLEDIKRAALEADEKEKSELSRIESEKAELLKLRQEGYKMAKSSSLAALKAENTRLRAELSHMRHKSVPNNGMDSVRDVEDSSPSELMSLTNSDPTASNSLMPTPRRRGVSVSSNQRRSAGAIQSLFGSSADQTSSPMTQPSQGLSPPPEQDIIKKNLVPKNGTLLNGSASQLNTEHAIPPNETLSTAEISSSSSSPSSDAISRDSHFHNPKLHNDLPPEPKIVLHNIMVLIGTTLLVTLSGLWIMFFFNPPMAPEGHGPLLVFKPPIINTARQPPS